LTDFKNSSIVGLSGKFATRCMSYFPPHLQCVAALPCEKHNIKNSKILMYLTQYHRFSSLFTKLTE